MAESQRGAKFGINKDRKQQNAQSCNQGDEMKGLFMDQSSELFLQVLLFLLIKYQAAAFAPG